METKKQLLSGKQKKNAAKRRALDSLIKKRNKKYFDALYKLYRETSNNIHYPWGKERLATTFEKTAEWEETRKDAILVSDWEKMYDLCLQQLTSDRHNRELALMR